MSELVVYSTYMLAFARGQAERRSKRQTSHHTNTQQAEADTAWLLTGCPPPPASPATHSTVHIMNGTYLMTYAHAMRQCTPTVYDCTVLRTLCINAHHFTNSQRWATMVVMWTPSCVTLWRLPWRSSRRGQRHGHRRTSRRCVVLMKHMSYCILSQHVWGSCTGPVGMRLWLCLHRIYTWRSIFLNKHRSEQAFMCAVATVSAYCCVHAYDYTYFAVCMHVCVLTVCMLHHRQLRAGWSKHCVRQTLTAAVRHLCVSGCTKVRAVMCCAVMRCALLCTTTDNMTKCSAQSACSWSS